VVLMPETEMAGAVEMAERIRTRLAGDAVIGEALTISVGVAQFPADGETPEALLARADAALYQAKRDGRNRIVRSSG
jgi:two-component system, cell cycle response regulator